MATFTKSVMGTFALACGISSFASAVISAIMGLGAILSDKPHAFHLAAVQFQSSLVVMIAAAAIAWIWINHIPPRDRPLTSSEFIGTLAGIAAGVAIPLSVVIHFGLISAAAAP